MIINSQIHYENGVLESGHKVRISGFTLVESLVAITIFLTVTTAAGLAIHSSLQAQRYAAEQTTASYLATEGIEVVRAFRDTQRLGSDEANVAPEDLFPAVCLGANGAGCYFDSLSLNIQPSSSTGGSTGIVSTPTFTQINSDTPDNPSDWPQLYRHRDGYSTGFSRVLSPYRRRVLISRQDFNDVTTYLVTTDVQFSLQNNATGTVSVSEVMYPLPSF